MPADTMAQVVNAALPKSATSSAAGFRRMRRRVFKVAACTAVLSAAALLAIVAFCKQLDEETQCLCLVWRQRAGKGMHNT